MFDYDPPLAEARARRPDKTYSKHVMLTEFGREKIEVWAQANGLNFSAAIEGSRYFFRGL